MKTNYENTSHFRNDYESFKQRLLPHTKRRSHAPHKLKRFNMESETEETATDYRMILQRVEYSLNVLNHVLIGFVTLYMSWLCISLGLQETALHAWLVTLGFVLLIAEGIVCYYNANALTHFYKRTTKTTVHWILQAAGGTIGSIGILLKCIEKDFVITSIHAKFGIAALVFCIVTMLSGVLALFSQGMRKVCSPVLNKSLHNFIGLVAFIIAMTAQCLGYEKNFFLNNTPEYFYIYMQCITALLILLTCIGPFKSLIHRITTLIN